MSIRCSNKVGFEYFETNKPRTIVWCVWKLFISQAIQIVYKKTCSYFKIFETVIQMFTNFKFIIIGTYKVLKMKPWDIILLKGSSHFEQES